MTERRYRDEEVRQIFKLATTDGVANPPSPTASGLTLSEVQSIGLEVGIEPDVVARAAAALDQRAPQAARTFMGMPIEVGAIVPLRSAMTDHQWDMLVGELRRTFRAKGKVSTDGSLREWRNGNLHASVEPAESGYRLRLGTVKGDARALNAISAISIVASLVTWGTHFLIFEPTSLASPMVFAAAGIGAFVANRLRLPAWARERQAQMEEIAAKTRSIMEQSTLTQ